jgi:ABC-type phosphate/phosphonate transport system substrate-binding protein
MPRALRRFIAVAGLLVLGAALRIPLLGAEVTASASGADTVDTLVVVVMDPLALPLSCPCVQGYAQRKYEKLGEKLEKDLGRPVRVVYNESLVTALKGDAKGRADLIIGKHSVVLFDAKKAGLKVEPIAKLSGKDGSTTQHGLVVVPTSDPAHSVSDLAGYRIVFGPEECDEKHAAALALLKQNGIKAPEKLETSAACSDGACLVLDEFKKSDQSRGAAVISSYAKPLLEGCGTVEKGSLRVVGETADVPFVEAFLSDQVPQQDREKLSVALLKSTSDPFLRIALETRDGFLAMPAESKPSAQAAETTTASADAKKK